MTDVRLPASGNIKLRWHAINAFANPKKPTPAEVNAGLKMEDSASWNDFAFGIQESNTTNDPALSAKSNTSDRGASQYGGAISIYLPPVDADNSNQHKVVYDALKTPRTLGWITMQVDGELSENNTPTYAGGLTQTAVSGDMIAMFKVMTAGYSNSITGEEAFRETISFLPQGEVYPRAIVATVLTVVVTPATDTVAIGAHKALEATVNGRPYTRGVRWTTSDATKVTVSQNGVATRKAAGAATITATYVGATGTSVLS